MVVRQSDNKSKKIIYQGVSLLGMLLAPPLLLYPGAKSFPGLMTVGYLVLGLCMIIPLIV